MLKTAITTVFLFAGVLFTYGTQVDQDFSREVVYRGSKLDGDVYLCTSDRVTSAGFRRNVDTREVTEVTEVSTQRNTTTWRITLTEIQAEVVVFTGATQTLEETEEFSVYRGSTGVLLTRQDGTSTETLTIDLSNSSFVYSGQDLHLFMNKTNIFVGSCRQYI